MSSEVEKVIKKADELSEQVSRLLFYMEDDPKTGHKGFISRLHNVEQQLERLEKEKTYKRGEKTATVAIYTGLGVFVTWFLTNLGGLIEFIEAFVNKGE